MWILFFFFMKEIYVLCLKTWFNFVTDPLISEYQNNKYSERRNNVDKHMLAQLSFSTKYQRWNNVGSSTLDWSNSFNVVSTLFYQCWNNVDKQTSAQLSVSAKFQRWNNIGSSTLNQRNSIDAALTLFQRWFNVDVFAGVSNLKVYFRLCELWYINCEKKLSLGEGLEE